MRRWSLDFYEARLERAIEELPAGLLARFLRYAERIETFGPSLGMPHSRAMENGLFELRLNAAEGIARVFYCLAGDGRVVFLHLLVEKSRKTPPEDLHVARRRMMEVRRGKPH